MIDIWVHRLKFEHEEEFLIKLCGSSAQITIFYIKNGYILPNLGNVRVINSNNIMCLEYPWLDIVDGNGKATVVGIKRQKRPCYLVWSCDLLQETYGDKFVWIFANIELAGGNLLSRKVARCRREIQFLDLVLH